MDESSSLLGVKETRAIPTPIVIPPSSRLRLDTSSILLADALRSEWSDRPSMVDNPELYYAFVSFNRARHLAFFATCIAIATAAFVKPAWCLDSDECKLSTYPTMLPESDMLHVWTGLEVELVCALVIGVVLYLDATHRGAKVRDWSSQPTRLLIARIMILGLYLCDILLAFVFVGTSSFQRWRLGGYLRPALFIALHDFTFNIWKLHLEMFPHLFEVSILILAFLFFFAVLGTNVFQKGEEGSDHFADLNSSLWSLMGLLTQSNTPQIFVDSFIANRLSIFFFISFLVFGVYGLLYILMATVFSQFQMRLEETATRNEVAKSKSLDQAFSALTKPALDSAGPPPLELNKSNLTALLQQFSLNVTAVSPALQAELLDSFCDEPSPSGGRSPGSAPVDAPGKASSVRSRADFEKFFGELEFRMGLSQHWPHEFPGRWTAFCGRVVTSRFAGWPLGRPVLEVVVDAVLLFNVIIYAIEASDCRVFHDKGKTCTLDFFEFIFNIFFLLELVVKVAGLGMRNYLDSLTNRLDFTATLSSSVLIIIYGAKLVAKDNSSVLELGVALRLTRCFRFLGYSRAFDLMAGVVNKIGSNVKGLAGFMLTLFLLWANLGQQLLGGTICVQSLSGSTNSTLTCPRGRDVEHTEYYQDRYYDCNFNDPMLSFLTLFVIMVGNDWMVIVDAYTHATNKFMRVYFVLWYIIAVFVALNTTLSFIIDTYVEEQKRQVAIALEPRKRSGRTSPPVGDIEA